MSWATDIDNYSDSTDYAESFEEWLYEDADDNTVYVAQIAARDLTPPVVGYTLRVGQWREWTGNDQDDMDHAAMMAHLRTVPALVEAFAAESPGLVAAAAEWAHTNMIDEMENQ